jgi:hypothetical protein
MLGFIYAVFCFFWALIIREKNDFEQTFFAFFSTLIVTPLFGKRLYYWTASYEIDKIRKEKAWKELLEKHKKARESDPKKSNWDTPANDDFYRKMAKK